MFVDGISRLNEFDAPDAFARSLNGARYDTRMPREAKPIPTKM